MNKNSFFLGLASMLALTWLAVTGQISGLHYVLGLLMLGAALRGRSFSLGIDNAFDAGLVTDVVTQQGLEVLQNRLAPLALFARDFSDEVMDVGRTMQIPIAEAAGATLTNPTNFEPGNTTTLGKVTVTLAHLFQPFHIDATEMAKGHRLERLMRINFEKLADKIWSAAITPITTQNFGAAVVTTTVITPQSGHLATLWAAVSKSARKGLVVSQTIYSQLIPTTLEGVPLGANAYGFENGVFYAHSFSGAVASLDGFACSQDAIAFGSAEPLIPEAVAQQYMLRTSVYLERIGMTVWMNVWGSTGNRRVNASFELMFGANAGVTDARGGGAMALIIG